MLDYASQAAINPCEALMSDIMAGQVCYARPFSAINYHKIMAGQVCYAKHFSAINDHKIMAGQTEMSEETGFSFYSGMLSIGSCIGYLLSALDWAKFGLVVGSREQTAFLLVLFLYIFCWGITMVAAKEKPHRIDR